MLQKINERIQGVVAWTVIILISVTFALFGVDYYVQSKDAGHTEVRVNGETISKQMFELQYRRERQMRDADLAHQESEKLLKTKILDEMVENLLVKQSAQRLGFYVSNTEADATILSIPQFQQDGHFSQSRYEQALSAAMYTPETFQSQVRTGMLTNQQRFALMGTAFALPAEVDRFVRLYMQKRSYKACIIPAALFQQQVHVSDEAIKRYYQTHQQDFLKPEQVKIEYVQLSTQALKKQIDVSPESQQTYYESNKHSFTVPAQWKVAHILFSFPKDGQDDVREKIKQKAEETYSLLKEHPEQFQTLVNNLSDDKLSARHHGELPWITAGTTSFDTALLQLKKPDDVSPPVLTTRGYELFKLIEFKKARVKPFSEVQMQIQDELLHDQLQSQYAEQLEKLSDLSYQTPDTLSTVSDALDLRIHKTNYFSRQGTQTGITNNPKIVNAAFSPEVLELGNNSEPIQLDDNTVIVLRVLKHQKARQKPLSDVRDAIIQTITHEESSRAAQQFGDKLLTQFSDQVAVDKILHDKNLVWQETQESLRDNQTLQNPQINEFAFTLSMNHRSGGVLLPNGDYALVSLSAIHDGRFDALDKELQASIAQQIEANYGITDYNLYVKSLLKQAKIER